MNAWKLLEAGLNGWSIDRDPNDTDVDEPLSGKKVMSLHQLKKGERVAVLARHGGDRHIGIVKDVKPTEFTIEFDTRNDIWSTKDTEGNDLLQRHTVRHTTTFLPDALKTGDFEILGRGK